MLRLVHVSDIHFKHGPGWDLDADQRDQLVVDLEGLLAACEETVDAIVVGGDVAFAGIRDEYDRAQEWIDRMKSASGCPEGNVWVVPGNHDVEWPVIDNSAIGKEFRGAVRASGLPELDPLLNTRMAVDPAGAALVEPFREYNRFAKNFGCETSAKKPEWFDRLGSMDGVEVKLWGLNSALISDRNDADDEAPPNLVLGTQQCKIKQKHGELRIVLCHHPPPRLKDWERAAPYLSRAHVLLFGHDHRFWCDQDGDRGQVRVHAGAVVPERDGRRVATYSLLRVGLEGEDVSLSVQGRIWSDEEKCFVGTQQDPTPFVIARDLRTLKEMADKNVPVDQQDEEEEKVTATPLAPGLGQGEAPVTVDEQARLREIAVTFMSGAGTDRIELARRLGVLEDGDLELDTDGERFAAILTRVRDRGLTAKLAEELGI